MASLVVMGVSGCGKSRIGAAVAARLGLPLIEGDEFHCEVNRTRMRSGVALTDADRSAWFDLLCGELQRHPGGAVLSCSALKASYRRRLRDTGAGLRFAWLDLDAASAQARVDARGGHFFPPSLVRTQFDALEPPAGEPGVLHLDALLPPEAITDGIVGWMSAPLARRPDALAAHRRAEPIDPAAARALHSSPTAA